MAYQALTLSMLISAPGDVLPADLQTVADTISRWNFRSGREMSTPVIVLPIWWSQHSYSVFGVRPQEALNEQLVDVADFGFALFANHLGTDTGVSPSGTVEEIDRLLAADKPVSVARNTAVPLPPGVDATARRLRLETYLAKIMEDHSGLFYEYRTSEGLVGQLENVLTAQAKRAPAQVPTAGVDQGELDRLLEDGYRPSRSANSDLGVWPTVESETRVGSDSRGRPKSSRQFYLVLTNTTGRQVKNVRFRYSPKGPGTTLSTSIS